MSEDTVASLSIGPPSVKPSPSGGRVTRLRDLRAERMLGIGELAKAAHVARSTIYLIEHGRSVPRPAVARRIAAALGVPPLEVDEFHRTIEDLRRPPRRRGREPEEEPEKEPKEE